MALRGEWVPLPMTDKTGIFAYIHHDNQPFMEVNEPNPGSRMEKAGTLLKRLT